jgi:hypothetical protein
MFRPSPVREAVGRLVFVAAAIVLFVMIPFDTHAQTGTDAVVEMIVITCCTRGDVVGLR